MLIPGIVCGQENWNLTMNTVSLKYTYQGVEYVSTEHVYYEPEEATARLLDPPLLQQYCSSKKYCVYNIRICVPLVDMSLRERLYNYATKCE